MQEVIKTLNPSLVENFDGEVNVYWFEYDDFLKSEHKVVFVIQGDNVLAMTNVLGLDEEVDMCKSTSIKDLKELLLLSKKTLKQRVRKIHNVKKSIIKICDIMNNEGYEHAEKIIFDMLYDNALEYFSH